MFQQIVNRLGLNRSSTSRQARRTSGFFGHRRLRHELLENRRMLATLTVNVIHDNVEIDGTPLRDDGDLTLRDAIAYVNGIATPGSLDIESNGVVHIDLTEPLGTNDTILFDLPPNKDTITLNKDASGGTINPDAGGLGDLDITESVTIDAQGQNITIDASGNDPTPGKLRGQGSLLACRQSNVI